MPKCEKLPKLIEMTDYPTLHAYKNALRAIFDDLARTELYFNNEKIIVQYGRFKHLIECEVESGRDFDSQRSRHFRWAKHVLKNCRKECNNLWIWQDSYVEGKYKILCPRTEYLIILQYFNDAGGYVLLSAYKAWPKEKEKYKAEYNYYLKNKKRPLL